MRGLIGQNPATHHPALVVRLAFSRMGQYRCGAGGAQFKRSHKVEASELTTDRQSRQWQRREQREPIRPCFLQAGRSRSAGGLSDSRAAQLRGGVPHRRLRPVWRRPVPDVSSLPQPPGSFPDSAARFRITPGRWLCSHGQYRRGVDAV